jgi:hypothetical protein
MMGRRRRTFVRVMLALMTGMLIASSTELDAASRSRPTAVAISDIKSVAGRWSGILYGRPGGTRQQDWVELALHEDGTYRLASARMIGVFSGSGTLSLADGRLASQGEKAQVMLTLHQGGGKRFLRVEGTMASGQPLRADLYPAP